MIKIKKQEFIKFIEMINEMRSGAHSDRMDYIAKEEDFAPIEVEDTVSLQLTDKMPSTDPQEIPGSQRDLSLVAQAIAKEVPNSQIENFYLNIHKIFQKAIDQSSDTENPFIRLHEAQEYMFGATEDSDYVEIKAPPDRSHEPRKSRLSKPIDFDKVEDEVIVDEPFELDKQGIGTHVDLSKVRNSNSKEVVEISVYIKTPEFTANMEDPDFKTDFLMQADTAMSNDQMIDVMSFDTDEDPLDAAVGAIEGLIITLQKYITLKKIEVFNRTFTNSENKISSSVLRDMDSVTALTALDTIIPGFLHYFAVVTNYHSRTGPSRKGVRHAILNGMGALLEIPEAKAQMARIFQRNRKAVKKGDLSFLRDDNEDDFDMSDFDDMSQSEIDQKKKYAEFSRGGTIHDVIRSAGNVYFTLAKGMYEISTTPASEFRNSSSLGRIQKSHGDSYKGKMGKPDTSSSMTVPYLRLVSMHYTMGLTPKQSSEQIDDSIWEKITNDNGDIEVSNSIGIGKELLSMDKSDMNETEVILYSAIHKRVTEFFREKHLKIAGDYKTTDADLYDWKNKPKLWKLLSPEANLQVNKQLKGIDNVFVDELGYYIDVVNHATPEVMSIRFKSSKETGGNVDVEFPTAMFTYMAPFILGKIWYGTIESHFEKYKYRRPKKGKTRDSSQDMHDIMDMIKRKGAQGATLSKFFGMSSSGFRQWGDQHVVLRFIHMKNARVDGDSAGGQEYLDAIDDAYGSLTPVFIDGLTEYISRIDLMLETDADALEASPDELQYFQILRDMFSGYLEEFEQIDAIIADYGVFDIRGPESDGAYEMVAELTKLLSSTTAGKALRLAVHDSFSDESDITIMSKVNQMIKDYATELFVGDPELDFEALGKLSSNPEARDRDIRSRIPTLVKPFYYAVDMPNYDANPHQLKILARELIKIGVDKNKFDQIHQKVIKHTDKIFEKVFQKQKKKKGVIQKNTGKLRKKFEEKVGGLSKMIGSGNFKEVFEYIEEYVIQSIEDSEADRLLNSAFDDNINDIDGQLESIKGNKTRKGKKTIANDIKAKGAEALALGKEADKLKKQRFTARKNRNR